MGRDGKVKKERIVDYNNPALFFQLKVTDSTGGQLHGDFIILAVELSLLLMFSLQTICFKLCKLASLKHSGYSAICSVCLEMKSRATRDNSQESF